MAILAAACRRRRAIRSVAWSPDVGFDPLPRAKAMDALGNVMTVVLDQPLTEQFTQLLHWIGPVSAQSHVEPLITRQARASGEDLPRLLAKTRKRVAHGFDRHPDNSDKRHAHFLDQKNRSRGRERAQDEGGNHRSIAMREQAERAEDDG
jgi:hypothetical protein